MAYPMPPCRENGKDCPERRCGCQAVCQPFAEFRRRLDDIHKAKANESVLLGYTAAAVDSTKDRGSRPPSTIIKDAEAREERRLRNAKVKVNSELH